MWVFFQFGFQMENFSLKILVGLLETGFVGGDFSLSSSWRSKMGFFAHRSISKSSNVVGEKGVIISGLKRTVTFTWGFCQEMSNAFISDSSLATGIQILCSSTKGNFIRHFICFLVTGVNGIRP